MLIPEFLSFESASLLILSCQPIRDISKLEVFLPTTSPLSAEVLRVLNKSLLVLSGIYASLRAGFVIEFSPDSRSLGAVTVEKLEPVTSDVSYVKYVGHDSLQYRVGDPSLSVVYQEIPFQDLTLIPTIETVTSN